MTATTTATFTPQPGDIGLVTMGGMPGRLIRIGQWLNGDKFANFEHAFVYLGHNTIIEAEPGGAKVTGLHYAESSIHWCSGIAKLWTDEKRSHVLPAARRYSGVPYSAADYFAIAAHTLHIPGNRLLKNYVASTKHMICSQLADQVAQDCGVQIFDDGEWPGYVSPGGLYVRDLELLASGR
jgi:hypothetical protein